MFTSRAEYRLMLREDNADLRLTERGHKLGLVAEHRWTRFSRKCEQIESTREDLSRWLVRADNEDAKAIASHFDVPMQKDQTAIELLRRPELSCQGLQELFPDNIQCDDPAVLEQLEIQVRYQGYIDRQLNEVEKQRRHSDTKIPPTLNYQNVSGLSTEVQQKLTEQRPETVGQASRIPGVTPAAVSLILVSLKKQELTRAAQASCCLLYTSPSPRDATLSRMPSSA